MRIKRYYHKRILILHGFGATPEECFYKNMGSYFSGLGFDVEIPLLPNPDSPNDIEQSKSIKGKFDVVIGHSFGSVTALRYTESHKLDNLILVSGFIDTNFYEDDPDIEYLKNSSTWKFHFKKIIDNCKNINVLYPNKDTSVTYDQTKKLSNRLKCKITRFQEEEDHACGDHEDELIQLISDIIGPQNRSSPREITHVDKSRITKFKLFESRISDQEIHAICKEYDITGYDINPDGSISVDGSVDLSGRSLKRIPLVFKEVSGYFYCNHNQLKGLEGCPGKVGGDFYCSYNQLTSLEGCPEKVGDNFYCGFNQLTSLKGCPDAMGIYCYNNKIISFEGIPEFWEDYLNIFSNPVDEIFELFNQDVRCIDLINEFDVIQGDCVIRDRLEEVFSQLNMEIPNDIKLKSYKLI